MMMVPDIMTELIFMVTASADELLMLSLKLLLGLVWRRMTAVG